MPRTVKPLSAVQINAATPNGTKIRKLFDGHGLQLWVMPDGKKYWRADFRIDGKRMDFAIGPYPKISLVEARKASQAARALAATGINPIADRKAKKAQGQEAAQHTFEAIAQKVIGKAQAKGRADSTLAKKGWILRKFSKGFRATPISKLGLPELKRELTAYSETGTGEIGFRMKILITQTFRRAAQDSLITYNPAHDLKDIVERKAHKHHAAITNAEPFAELLRKVDEYTERNVLTGSALQLMALLYQRPGELRKADWAEFDLKNSVWEIPAERMKMRRSHTVYLPRQAVAILARLKEITGPTGFVFPSIGRSVRPMSENTMNQALRRMGIAADKHSSHGFRATASTLLNGSSKWGKDVVEISLSHKDPDAVRAAYARGEFEIERAKMAQWWADHLDRLRRGGGSNVLALAKA